MGYTALYRKFRPQKFSEMYGQEHIVKTLKNQVISDRVGHAYLFTGCRGCGKTTSAKILARAVNCLNSVDGEPCNECSVCKAAIDGTLTDIVEMDAASNNGVDDIRSIRDEVNFLPTVAKYRVYIIDEVHMLSSGAFNALLKTLEEPPKHVKFILATTEPQKLPVTILSRCQRFDFKAIEKSKIVANLTKICNESGFKFEDIALDLIAELSEGAMRDALSILERCSQDDEDFISFIKVKELVGIPENKKIFDIVEAILKKDIDSVVFQSNKLIQDGVDVSNFLFEMVRLLRDILVYKVGVKLSDVYSKDDIDRIDVMINGVDKEQLIYLINDISKAENRIKISMQKSIIFQTELIMLCQIQHFVKENVVEKKVSKVLLIDSLRKVENPKKKDIISNDVNSDFWENVLKKLKEENLYVLYSALANARVVKKDDLIVEIYLANDFQKGVVNKLEYLTKIRELVSLEFNKDMMIKVIDQPKKSDDGLADLGFNVNIIE